MVGVGDPVELDDQVRRRARGAGIARRRTARRGRRLTVVVAACRGHEREARDHREHREVSVCDQIGPSRSRPLHPPRPVQPTRLLPMAPRRPLIALPLPPRGRNPFQQRYQREQREGDQRRVEDRREDPRGSAGSARPAASPASPAPVLGRLLKDALIAATWRDPNRREDVAGAGAGTDRSEDRRSVRASKGFIMWMKSSSTSAGRRGRSRRSRRRDQGDDDEARHDAVPEDDHQDRCHNDDPDRCDLIEERYTACWSELNMWQMIVKAYSAMPRTDQDLMQRDQIAVLRIEDDCRAG